MLTASFRPPSGGWYSRPQPQMQRRGRSRHVSPVALARRASEERRRNELAQRPPCHPNTDPASLLLQSDKADPSMNTLDDPPLQTPVPNPSLTSSHPDVASASPHSYDAPPSPPSSLEDQIQVAYALDDIRLAKILLLKLKGIQVSSDSDPRIDQVRDEDFDMCFAPSGPLVLEEADKQAVQETRRKQRQWWQESQRTQRLRACEQLWQDEKQRLHDDRLRAVQRRQQAEEECRHQVELRQHTERERQQRSSLSHTNTPPSSKCHEDPFQYTFMPPTVTATASSSRRSLCSPKATKKNTVRSPGSQHRAVSFKEVLNSMNGNLFPLDASERAEDARRTAGLSISSPSRYRRTASLRAELLGTLLQVVEWPEEGSYPTKGKHVERDPQFVKSPVQTHTPLSSVPSSDSVTFVASSTSTSRSSSWLSFSSWRSSCTDVTIPDSPASASPCCSIPSLPMVAESRHDLLPRCSFVRVSLEETPLSPPRASACGFESDEICGSERSYATGSAVNSFDDARTTFVRRFSRSLSGIVHAAKGIQSAYIAATVFSAGPSHASYDPRSYPHDARWRPRPEGYRAHPRDVKKFNTSESSATLTSEPVHFIPLVSPFPQPPSTPNPKPQSGTTIVIPSPLRPRTPPAALAYRMRPVANPALLRLRALQNLMCARGKEWEGRARDGNLGCGKERMLGVAFEGRGRSGLGCEVRFVVA